MDKVYEDLANAIVVQAFDDYTPACIKVQKTTLKLAKVKEQYEAAKAECDAVEAEQKTISTKTEIAKRKLKRAGAMLHRQEGLLISAEAEKKSIEDFFTSPWYSMLTKVDGKVLLREAQKRAKERLEGMV